MESLSSVKIKSEASLFTGGPHSNQTVAGGHLFFQSPKKHGCTSFMSSVVSWSVQVWWAGVFRNLCSYKRAYKEYLITGKYGHLELCLILEEPASFASHIFEQKGGLVLSGVDAKFLRMSEAAKTGELVEKFAICMIGVCNIVGSCFESAEQ